MRRGLFLAALVLALSSADVLTVEWPRVTIDASGLVNLIPSLDVIGGTSPFKEPGLHVLIVEETGDRSKLPAYVFGPTLRAWLDANCVKSADGKGWHLYDKDVATTGIWAEVMARPRTATPWLIVGNGKSGFEGPLPATEAETMDLLKKFGG